MEEYNKLGIADIKETIEKLDNNNISTLNSDFNSLILKMFNMTKFENSKPHKMIDYILQSDKNYLTSQTDKEMLEEIKKTIYFRSSDGDHNSQNIYKSIFNHFKSNFKNSSIIKIFDSLHEIIVNSNKSNDTSHLSQELKNSILERKDKSSYQNYLSDKLKSNYNNEIINELNDTEMWKSLIYLCNKNIKNTSKIYSINLIQNVKMELISHNEFSNVVKSNLEFIHSSENTFQNKKENFCKSVQFKKLKKKIYENKLYKSYIEKKINKIFPNEAYKLSDPSEGKKILSKLLEFFYREKENDFEKILKKIEKFDKNNENDKKELKTFWSQFKFFFYLNTLNKENPVHLTDEKFWKTIQDYINENSDLIRGITLKKSIKKKIVKDELIKSTEKLEKKKETIKEEYIKEEIKIENYNNTKESDNAFKNDINLHLEDEYNKFILNKINNEENIFEIIKPTGKKEYKKKKLEMIQTTENVSYDEEILKPKSVRVIPGYNPTNGNIIINNFYNIFNNNNIIGTIKDPNETIAIVQNIQNLIPNSETNNNFVIQLNSNLSDEKLETPLKSNFIIINLLEKKGRPKKEVDNK